MLRGFSFYSSKWCMYVYVRIYVRVYVYTYICPVFIYIFFFFFCERAEIRTSFSSREIDIPTVAFPRLERPSDRSAPRARWRNMETTVRLFFFWMVTEFYRSEIIAVNQPPFVKLPSNVLNSPRCLIPFQK